MYCENILNYYKKNTILEPYVLEQFIQDLHIGTAEVKIAKDKFQEYLLKEDKKLKTYFFSQSQKYNQDLKEFDIFH